MAALMESMNWQLLTFPKEIVCVTDREPVVSANCFPPPTTAPMVICGAFHPGIFPEKTRDCSPVANWHISKSPLRTQLMELLPLRMVRLSSTIVPDIPKKQRPSWLGPQMKVKGVCSWRHEPVPGVWVSMTKVLSFQVTQPTWLDEEVVERAQSSSKVQSCSITATSKERVIAVFHIFIIVLQCSIEIKGVSMGQ